MKTGIIIQARMSSTRLPGKIMLPLAGQEMLWHVVERCRQSQRADLVIVATTTDASDNPTAEFCHRHHYPVYRGSLDNVLDRYYQCAREFDLETINRITSDCPLIDAGVIDESFALLEANRAAGVVYASNLLHRDFPRGLDCEAFTMAALTDAWKNARTTEEREHVTVYLRGYTKVIPHCLTEKYRANFRLVIDEPVDYRLLSHLYDRFYRPGELIDLLQVIEYLKANPTIANLNAQVEQKKVPATPEQQKNVS